MTIGSCLYVGSVMHRRHVPRRHHFRYRAFWLLLDLDDLPTLSRRTRWLSHNRANLFSLYDRDHGDGSTTPLRAQIERGLRDAGVDLAGGTIRLLCMPRTLGYGFNPLSIFFCHQADGALACIVYQVHNTFGQRHSYVIPAAPGGAALHQGCTKRFYVSPFLDMEMSYEFRISGPRQRISVAIKASDRTGPVLHAVLSGAARPLDARNLLGVFWRIPAVTLKVIAAIHWEALRLWLKGIALRPRPAPPPGGATAVHAHPALSD